MIGINIYYQMHLPKITRTAQVIREAGGNISRVLRGEMPELTGAEDKARAKQGWELIYKLGTLL